MSSGNNVSPLTHSEHDLVRARTQLGDFELTVCTDGTYMLDGGAMFGVVPKPLWQKRAPADEQNRILRMEFRGFVQTFILIPAQVLLRGRQLVLRLLAWRPTLPTFFRLLDAL